MATNRRFNLHTQRLVTFVLCVAVFMLATACRQQSAEAQPTEFATLAPTPRSTALPAIATAVAPGEAGNPLQMVIRPDSDLKNAQNAASDFEKAVLDESGLVIQVQVVERYAEALAALCGSSGGSTAAAWLNGLSYTAAVAQHCGQPVMQVERGTGSDKHTGQAVAILVKKDANFSSAASLRNKTFCRIGYDDLDTWLLPSLLLQAARVTPLNLKAVNDYPDIPKLVEAVAAGDCDAAGVPADVLDQFADDLGKTATQVKILDTSIEFPYAVLMVPVEVPLGTRLTLTNTLTKLASNSATAVKMRALLGQNALTAANTDDFKELADFMASTGLDFAQLGN
jgi:ABC-type phosphate/phosphonate transport system substrate-binding protein